MMRFAWFDKRLFSFLISLVWGAFLILMVPFTVAAQSTNALATNPALIAELGLATTGAIQAVNNSPGGLAAPGVTNSTITLKKKSRSTGSTLSSKTVSSNPVKDFVIAVGRDVTGALIAEGLSRFIWGEPEIQQIQELALQRYNDNNTSLNGWQGFYLGNTHLADYYISRLEQRGNFVDLYAFGGTPSFTTCVYYQSETLIATNSGTISSSGFNLGEPRIVQNTPCATSSEPVDNWDDLTDEQKEEALDQITQEDLIDILQPDQEVNDFVDQPLTPDEYIEYCIQGDFTYVDETGSYVGSEECFIYDPNAEELDPGEQTQTEDDGTGFDGTDAPSEPTAVDTDGDGEPDCLECSERTWGNYPNFFLYAYQQLRRKFPFDILGSLPSVDNGDACPTYSYKEYSYDFCFINQVYSPLKYLLVMLYILTRLIPFI